MKICPLRRCPASHWSIGRSSSFTLVPLRVSIAVAPATRLCHSVLTLALPVLAESGSTEKPSAAAACDAFEGGAPEPQSRHDVRRSTPLDDCPSRVYWPTSEASRRYACWIASGRTLKGTGTCWH